MHLEKCSMRITMIALLFLLATQGKTAESKPYTGKVFLGIAGDSVELDEDPRYESTHGVLLTRISAGSTGGAAGLKKGDTLVSIDDVAWTSNEIRLSRSFGKAGDKASPGEKVILSVLRSEKGDDDKQRFERIEAELLRYPRTRPEKSGARTNDMLRPDLKDKYPTTHDLCWKFIRTYGFEPGCVDLLARLDRSQQFPDPDRLPIVQYACRDPFKLEAISREIINGLKPNRSLGVGDCRILLDMAEHVLIKFERYRSDKEAATKIPAITFLDKDLKGHIDHVESVLAAAAKTHKKAFAALSESEIQYIRQNRHRLLNSFMTFKMLSYDTDYDRQKAALKVLDLACRVDVGTLIEQSRIISALVAPEFNSSLKDAAEASGADLDAAVVLTRDTAHGAIMVAGRSRQRYGTKDYAVIYELGGVAPS